MCTKGCDNRDITAYDPMHTVHGGLFRSALDSHRFVIGAKNTNSERKAQVDNVFSTLKFVFSQNSDRDYSRECQIETVSSIKQT
jgi:hypothetical protein